MKYFKESSLDKTHDELKWKNKIKNNPEEAVWEINKKKIQELRILQLEIDNNGADFSWEIEQQINFLESLSAENNL